MFEGKRPPTPGGDTRSNDAAGQEGLRALSWEELVAKLAAERDLRHELIHCPESQASFDAHSARHLASLHEHEAQIAQRTINLLDLANGKGDEVTSLANEEHHPTGPRGNK